MKTYCWLRYFIDGSSKDSTGITCGKYKGRDSRIEVIYQSNKGL